MLLFQSVPDTLQHIAAVAPCPECPCANHHIGLVVYAVCIVVGLVGAVIHFVQGMKEDRNKAIVGHYEWTEKTYFNDQKWAIVLSVLWIVAWALILTEAVAAYDTIFEWKKLIFLVIGYGGDSLSSRLAGFATKRALGVLDDKSTGNDKAAGTLEGPPTPAIMPTEDPVKKYQQK